MRVNHRRTNDWTPVDKDQELNSGRSGGGGGGKQSRSKRRKRRKKGRGGL